MAMWVYTHLYFYLLNIFFTNNQEETKIIKSSQPYKAFTFIKVHG